MNHDDGLYMGNGEAGADVLADVLPLPHKDENATATPCGGPCKPFCKSGTIFVGLGLRVLAGLLLYPGWTRTILE